MNAHEVAGFCKSDGFQLLCGRHIGKGAFRNVFECGFDPSLVVKVESEQRSFSNVMEWEVWHSVVETEFEKWFAPVVQISPNGSVLLQRRTTPVLKWPERIPSFFTDIKRANFGMFNGNFVCHDYGLNMLIERGLTRRLSKVNWRDWEPIG
jgi:hypothetical protein